MPCASVGSAQRPSKSAEPWTKAMGMPMAWSAVFSENVGDVKLNLGSESWTGVLLEGMARALEPAVRPAS